METELLDSYSPQMDRFSAKLSNHADENLPYQLFMQSPAILCTLRGPHHVFGLVNDAYRKMVGNRDLVGKAVIEVLPEIASQGFIELLDKVYATGESFEGRELPVVLNVNGRTEKIYLNFHYQPFYAGDKIEGILVFGYDVTELVIARNKVKKDEEKYRELIYGLPSALYTCDANGYVQMYNEAAVKLWGRRPEIGKDLWGGSWKIFRPDGSVMPLDQCPMAIALNEGRVVHDEIVVKRPDGSTRNVIPYPQATYDENGRLSGAINSLIDITDQVAAREQMEQIAKAIENLYMNAPAFVCTLKGPEFVYELVNPRYQQQYGSRQLLGKRLIDALPEIKGTGIIELLQNVYKTGEPYVATELLLYVAHDEGKDPEPTYFNFSYQPMYNLQKEIDGILVFGYDVTEQVLARKKGEEEVKKVLESLPQITSTSSADGTNIFFNNFFFEYSGLTREEAAKEGWNSILHPSEIEPVLSQWEECKRTGKDFYREIRLRRKSDGNYRWHIARITPIKDSKGKVTQWIASATDIHPQKIKEQKKDEFLSIASHEMKTPLTTANAYLQLLEMSLEDGDEKIKDYTRKAIASLGRLRGLISELLDVSKIQHGKLDYNFTTFNFDEMLDAAIEAIQCNSPKHKIIKKGTIPVPVIADKDRLQQVVVNLLSNAIKYSPDSKSININISLEKDEIKVAVHDHGIGINKNNLEKIFERYYRVEGLDIHFQGLGIGLFISRQIIRRHNGKLWAESEPFKGSTFTFTIPLQQKVKEKVLVKK